MATITGATLNLTKFIEGGQQKVEIKVTYNAVFSECERALSPNLKFRETIQIVGVDILPPTEEILIDNVLPVQNITVSTGSGSLTVPRTRTVKALRSLLQEDVPGDDEIRCKINIVYVAASTPVVSASANAAIAG